MRGGHTKRLLRGLREQAGSWDQVPLEARSFHRSRGRLLEDLDDLERRWLPWGGEVTAQELQARAKTLQETASALESLFRRRREAGRLLHDMAEMAGRPEVQQFSELARWMEQEIGDRRVELVRLGESCRRPEEVELDRLQMETLLPVIEQDRRDIQLLSEAAERLMRHGPKAGEDASALGDLCRRLLARGADEAWRAELKAVLESLRELDVASIVDVQASHRLDDVMVRLWEWARVSPAHRSVVAQLSERRERTVLASEAVGGAQASARSELSQLLESAEALLGKIEAEALETRRQRRQQFEERLQTLAQLTVQKDLERRFRAWIDQTADEPRQHREWFEESRTLEALFRDRLQNAHQRIGSAFQEAANAVRKRLEKLHGHPLGGEMAVQLEAFAARAQALFDAKGVEGQFEAIYQLRALGNELETLKQQMVLEWTLHEQRIQELQRRTDRMKQLSGVVPGQYSLGDLDRAQVLLETKDMLDLDSAGRMADERERLLLDAEARFVQACLRERDRLYEEDRQLATTLDLAGTLGLLADSPLEMERETIEPPTTPDQAALMVEAARQHRGRLKIALGGTWETIEREASLTVGRLESLDEERLRPGERKMRRDLLAEYGSDIGPRVEEGGVEDRLLPDLQRILDWWRHQSDLVDRVEGNRRRAGERHAGLIARLAELERHRLAERCPEKLVHRCHAWVHGLNGWDLEKPDVEGQLNMADRLLYRLETHAGWRVANEIEAARQKLFGMPTPKARELLAELDSCSPDHPPSPELRDRLSAMVEGGDFL